jgi:hypothetical protein
MKYILIISSLLISVACFGQEKKQSRFLKVLDVKEYEHCYLITGIDSLKMDSLYLLSVKDSLHNDCSFQKIKVGRVYLFEIEDMDNINGHLPPALPNGYFIKFGDKRIKRDGRNGNTVTTTQFVSKNSKGLWIKKLD